MLTKLSAAAAALALTCGVAGCGVSRAAGPDAPPPTPDGPTREQVLMADGLCAAAATLDADVAEARSIAEPSSTGYTGPGADFYLTFVDSDLEMLATALEDLPESGVEAADRYAASFLAEVRRIMPEITALAGDTWGLSEPQQVEVVAQVLELYESIDPEGPDLRTLARDNRDFRAFYDLAPRCAPLEPAPPPPTPSVPNVAPEDAEDGTDLTTCEDGDCEVAITGRATVTVGDFTIDITVAGEQVTAAEDFPSGGSGVTALGLGGSSSFGAAGAATVTITLLGLHGDTAVVEFSTD